eukprot:741725-Prorocentrum_minimum.AAC.1
MLTMREYCVPEMATTSWDSATVPVTFTWPLLKLVTFTLSVTPKVSEVDPMGLSLGYGHTSSTTTGTGEIDACKGWRAWMLGAMSWMLGAMSWMLGAMVWMLGALWHCRTSAAMPSTV